MIKFRIYPIGERIRGGILIIHATGDASTSLCITIYNEEAPGQLYAPTSANALGLQVSRVCEDDFFGGGGGGGLGGERGMAACVPWQSIGSSFPREEDPNTNLLKTLGGH